MIATDDTADGNVRPFPGVTSSEPQPGSNARSKDRTGAARQAKFRNKNKRDRYERRRKDTPPSTDVDAPPTATPVTRARNGVMVHTPPLAPDTGVHARHGRGITFAALVAALALAAVSGGFSITGMTSIFVGAFWPVIGMGAAPEVGKLAAVAWLGHQRGTASWRLRAALATLVAVLMPLNAVGCYGFLAKAHIGHQVEGETAIGGRMAEIQGRLSVQEGIVAGLDRQIAQIDNAVTKATDKGRTGAAMQLAADQKRNRSDLVNERVRQGKVLADLQVEKAKVDGDRKVADADLGPVRYLATLLGAGDQEVLRYFILVVAVLLDPAAVLLLLAATRR